MIRNPIFQREVKSSLRDLRVVALILGFVALLSGMLAKRSLMGPKRFV